MIEQLPSRGRGLCFLAVLTASPLVQAAFPVIGGPIFDTSGSIGFYARDVAGVSDVGIAAGNTWFSASPSEPSDCAVIWDAAGSMKPLAPVGTPPAGRGGSHATAVAPSGLIVGNVAEYVGGQLVGVHAARWDQNGRLLRLDGLGTDATGWAYNSSLGVAVTGFSVGVAHKYVAGVDMGNRAVRWDPFGTPVELETPFTGPGGTASSSALAINRSHVAVGSAAFYVNGMFMWGSRALRWDASGAAQELVGLETPSTNSVPTFNQAVDVNAAGTAIGSATRAGAARAVRWDPGTTTAAELAALSTDADGFTMTEARDINDAGFAAGCATTYESHVPRGLRAVRWTPAGNAQPLQTLDTNQHGFTDAEAFALNDAGIAVGFANYYGGGNDPTRHAVYWDLDGSIVDLNELLAPDTGWLLNQADAISNTGWIAGVGTFDPDGPGPATGYQRLFTLQIPAPTTAPVGIALLTAAGTCRCARRPARSTFQIAGRIKGHSE